MEVGRMGEGGEDGVKVEVGRMGEGGGGEDG